MVLATCSISATANSPSSLKASSSATTLPPRRSSRKHRMKIDEHATFGRFIDEAGKESAPSSGPWTSSTSIFKFEVPEHARALSAALPITGSLQQGDSKPFWLKYFAKPILPVAISVRRLGGISAVRVPLEIRDSGRRGHQAPISGRIICYGSCKPAGFQAFARSASWRRWRRKIPRTDRVLTKMASPKEFERAGHYGAGFAVSSAKSGEDKGKKYDGYSGVCNV